MSTQFCKVGNIKPNLSKIISLKEFEKKLAYFVDDVNKIKYFKDLHTNF